MFLSKVGRMALFGTVDYPCVCVSLSVYICLYVRHAPVSLIWISQAPIGLDSRQVLRLQPGPPGNSRCCEHAVMETAPGLVTRQISKDRRIQERESWGTQTV